MTKSDMFVSPPSATLGTIANELSSVDVLVIGAGPTGLGAGKRLHQLVGSTRFHRLTGAMLTQDSGWAIVDDY